MEFLRVNKKFYGLIVAFFMTLALDTTMTFTMTSINTGWTSDFLPRFLQSWVLGFVVAFPTSILILPLARKAASKVTSKHQQ